LFTRCRHIGIRWSTGPARNLLEAQLSSARGRVDATDDVPDLTPPLMLGSDLAGTVIDGKGNR